MAETKYDRVGDVAVVTMANPPANTFTMELSAGLEAAVRPDAVTARGSLRLADHILQAKLAVGDEPA